MEKLTLEIIEPIGVHAKVAANIVHIASQYESDITLTHNNENANMKSILNLLALGIRTHDKIEITIEGKDEFKASKGVEDFFKDNNIAV